MVFIMKDPYQILNITPDATDEQVREAYRSLARKYQPENYENSPLADMAAKKMDEINGAYDAIITMRRSQSSSAQSGYSCRIYGRRIWRCILLGRYPLQNQRQPHR